MSEAFPCACNGGKEETIDGSYWTCEYCGKKWWMAIDDIGTFHWVNHAPINQE